MQFIYAIAQKHFLLLLVLRNVVLLDIFVETLLFKNCGVIEIKIKKLKWMLLISKASFINWYKVTIQAFIMLHKIPNSTQFC